ncbi:MAG: type II toxin-antitoxin system VapC family toxin [Campylobacterales bacterium]|nr:type II toxin-antitoxin system VapC family toxin [Campylobacterales bacterium]
MKHYLLDTALFLLWLENKERLSDTLYEILSNHDNTVYVSSASLLEIDIKKGLGEIKLDNINVEDVIEESQFHQLNVSSNALEIAKNLSGENIDPFNRTIIAQAIDKDLTLLTLNKSILDYEKVITF